MMDKNIIILIDENDISGVKVGNELFFRHENEPVTVFYNKRIVPLLKEKGIDFVKLHREGNISKMAEEDYELTKEDNINITKAQIQKILDAEFIQELEYDEKMYLARIFEKALGYSYDYKKHKYESVITMQASAEYIEKSVKQQKRYDFKYVYALALSKYADNSKISAVCPHCGGAVSDMTLGHCEYCGAQMVDIIERNWTVKEIIES